MKRKDGNDKLSRVKQKITKSINLFNELRIYNVITLKNMRQRSMHYKWNTMKCRDITKHCKCIKKITFEMKEIVLILGY